MKFVPHGLLLWAVTAGLTTDSQHPGNQVWIHRNWGSKDREARSKTRFGNSEVCLTQGQRPLFQFHLYSMLQVRSSGLRPIYKPISVEKLSLETHYKFIIGDLESGCGHLETFKVDKLIQPIYIENLWVSLAKKGRHQKKGLLSFEWNEKPGIKECWFWYDPGYKS